MLSPKLGSITHRKSKTIICMALPMQMCGLKPDTSSLLRRESSSGEQPDGSFWHYKAQDPTTFTDCFVHQNVSRNWSRTAKMHNLCNSTLGACFKHVFFVAHIGKTLKYLHQDEIQVQIIYQTRVVNI